VRDLSKLSIFAVISVLFAACGIGGPGENNNNGNDDRPDAQVVDSGGDAGQNNNTTPTVRHISADELRNGGDGLPEGGLIFATWGQTLADLRPNDECQAAHIPNAYCVPTEVLWDGSAFLDDAGALTAVTMSEANPLVFYSVAADDATVTAVAEASLGLGYQDVYVLDGGIEAWRAQGWFEDVSRFGLLDLYYSVDATHMGHVADGAFLVDTMDAPTYATGHIDCALNIDGDTLWYNGQIKPEAATLLGALAAPTDDPVLVFYCVNQGCEASVAACLAAEQLGYPTVLHYKMGFQDWEGAGLPTATGTSACSAP